MTDSCAGVRFSSTGASGAVWADSAAAISSVAGAAVSPLISSLTASSVANRLWKVEGAHCALLAAKVGVYVVIERGFAKNALEGDELMARAAVRRRRYLHQRYYNCAEWRLTYTYMMGVLEMEI
jgi:hypothetical protein